MSSLCMESAGSLFMQRVIEPIRTGMTRCSVLSGRSDSLLFVLNQYGFAQHPLYLALVNVLDDSYGVLDTVYYAHLV